MTDKPFVTEEGTEFRRKAKPLVVESNLSALREQFARATADGRVANPENQGAVIKSMREALREALLDSTRNVKRDFFEDIFFSGNAKVIEFYVFAHIQFHLSKSYVQE